MIFRFTMSSGKPIFLTKEKTVAVIQSDSQNIVTTDYQGMPVQINKAYLVSMSIDKDMTASVAEKKRLENNSKQYKLPQAKNDKQFKKQREQMKKIRKSLSKKLKLKK